MSQGRKRLSFPALLNWRCEQQGSNREGNLNIPPGFIQNCHQIGAVCPRCCLQITEETNIPKMMRGKSFQTAASLYSTKGAMMLPISQEVEQKDTPKFLHAQIHKLGLLRRICGETVAFNVASTLYLTHVGKSSVLTKTTISTAMVTVNRPRLPTTVLNQNISEEQGGIRLDHIRLTCVP